MDVRYTVGKNEYKGMTPHELRDAFLVDLFEEGKINLLYCEVERAIVGAVIPTRGGLKLEAGKELAADYFCQRREVGVLNIGGSGTVTVDGTAYAMENLDGLYIGRGSKAIAFQSDSADEPARFYLISYPAHTDYPTAQAKMADANALELGSCPPRPSSKSRRTLHCGSRGRGASLCLTRRSEASRASGESSPLCGTSLSSCRHRSPSVCR